MKADNISRKWVLNTSDINDYHSKDDIENLEQELEMFPDFLKGLIKFREFTYYEINKYMEIISNMFSNDYNVIKRANLDLVELFFDIYYDYSTNKQVKVENIELFTQPNIIRSVYIILKEVKTRTMILDDRTLLQLGGKEEEKEEEKKKYKIKEYIDVWKVELESDLNMFNLYTLSLELKVPVSELINEPFSVIQSYIAALSIKSDLWDKELKKNK